MKKLTCFTVLLCLLLSLSGCGAQVPNEPADTNPSNSIVQNREEESMMTNQIPEALEQIPEEYRKPADVQGTLERLDYTTYEAFTYQEKSTVLNKTAYVYLPAGYDESKQYNVFYLMHGGWSNETTQLGTPDTPSEMKHILDHAIQDGKIKPLIVVCPTYNNLSGEDSGNYSLAIQLTDLYHQELVNDLIPAVESKYSSYAEDVTMEGLRNSRDHRGFGGFSMGSVATWRTFQYCLDYFRYFMPMSGNAGNGDLQDAVVEASDWNWNDFFIWTASGTEDFAYSAFKAQVMNMGNLPSGNFRFADNERDGNLSFLKQEGGTHNGYYANQYIYNGLMFFWNSPSEGSFSQDSTVGDVVSDPAFGDFGRLLFPVDRTVTENMTLADISSSSVYVWYSNIQPEKTVEIVNHLKGRAESGKPIFYPIYSEAERLADPTKEDTGLFYFGGEAGKPFAIVNAGGGFVYVGAMHDSFPHALELSKLGYHGFALIYRPDYAYEDLAQAIAYIYDNAEALGVDARGYSLWGGSAGARMAAVLGNQEGLTALTGRTDIPQAAAVIMQYTGYTTVSLADAPTYVCVGTKDGIASWKTMKSRLEHLAALGIPTEFHSYEGLSHGFGLGTNTVAENWLADAVNFWEEHR